MLLTRTAGCVAVHPGDGQCDGPCVCMFASVCVVLMGGYWGSRTRVRPAGRAQLLVHTAIGRLGQPLLLAPLLAVLLAHLVPLPLQLALLAQLLRRQGGGGAGSDGRRARGDSGGGFDGSGGGDRCRRRRRRGPLSVGVDDVLRQVLQLGHLHLDEVVLLVGGRQRHGTANVVDVGVAPVWWGNGVERSVRVAMGFVDSRANLEKWKDPS